MVLAPGELSEPVAAAAFIEGATLAVSMRGKAGCGVATGTGTVSPAAAAVSDTGGLEREATRESAISDVTTEH